MILDFDFKNYEEDCQLVFTQKGVVEHLFHSEVEKGNIHNSKVKTSKGHIVAFQMNGLMIEENPHVRSVMSFIERLNTGDDDPKYRYINQTLYSLAYEYYTKNYDRNITSYCKPQVYNILRDNINSPFLEFYKKKERLLMIRMNNIPIY